MYFAFFDTVSCKNSMWSVVSWAELAPSRIWTLRTTAWADVYTYCTHAKTEKHKFSLYSHLQNKSLHTREASAPLFSLAPPLTTGTSQERPGNWSRSNHGHGQISPRRRSISLARRATQ